MSKQRMEDNLSQALRALSEETRQGTARPEVKQALLAELRKQTREATPLMKRKSHIHWWHAAAAAVVLMGLGFGAARWAGKSDAPQVVLVPVQPGAAVAEERIAAAAPEVEMESPAAPVRPLPATRRAARRTAEAQQPQRWSDAGRLKPLTPWFYNTGLPLAERGQVLRLEVTAATAARFGVAAGGPVQAEVFIADDGLTRAIRFLQ